MAHKAPGKHYRKGLSWLQITNLFPNEEVAEQWFAQTRWPQGPICPHCQSTNIQSGATHKTMPYRCRTCRKRFSVRVGTVLENSRLNLRTWAIAMYILTTGLKGTSSMKIHRDLGVTQKTAWYLAHRIRETWGDKQVLVSPVEVDESYFGGLDKNKHADKKPVHGNTYGVKQAVVGMKSRTTNRVNAAVVPTVSTQTLQRFVQANTSQGGTVYSDQSRGYWGLRKSGYLLESVNHSVKEYVNGQAHTNGIESFWALLKRGYHGTFHHLSAKQLQRYVNEFAGRHNAREADTIEQMRLITKGLVGKQLPYKELTGTIYDDASSIILR